MQHEVEALGAKYPVWISDISNLQQALQMIEWVGALTGTQQKAGSITSSIDAMFRSAHPLSSAPKTAYLIWNDPYMTVGNDTFIHDMLVRAGHQNIFADRQRYPCITIEDLQQRNCELLLLSSEPFPFNKTHQGVLQAQLPHTRIMFVDGEMFSWYGSRLLRTPAYFSWLKEQLLQASAPDRFHL